MQRLDTPRIVDHVLVVSGIEPKGPPAARVADAFGVHGVPELLSGGQGSSWRVGAAVFKPADAGPATLAWYETVLRQLDGRSDFRVSPPLRSSSGELVVDGWTAWRYEEAEHVPRRWADILAVGRSFHAALRDLERPDFLDRRKDAWAVADRVAWGELPAPSGWDAAYLPTVLAALRPIEARSQLIHGDLTGNVLFCDDTPPLVIDLSPYWRAVRTAEAIVVADALVSDGALGLDGARGLDDVLRAAVGQEPDFGQYLLRALIFRAVTDQLTGRIEATESYRPAFELALRLAGP
jgi:uncharacterized protein (TIGR02569 family)